MSVICRSHIPFFLALPIIDTSNKPLNASGNIVTMLIKNFLSKFHNFYLVLLFYFLNQYLLFLNHKILSCI